MYRKAFLFESLILEYMKVKMYKFLLISCIINLKLLFTDSSLKLSACTRSNKFQSRIYVISKKSKTNKKRIHIYIIVTGTAARRARLTLDQTWQVFNSILPMHRAITSEIARIYACR